MRRNERKVALLYDRFTTAIVSSSIPARLTASYCNRALKAIFNHFSRPSRSAHSGQKPFSKLKTREVDFSRALTYPSACSK